MRTAYRTRTLPVVVVAVLAITSSPTTARAGQDDGVTVRATIGGRDLEDARSGKPLALNPHEEARVVVRVENHQPRAITLRSVRIAGRVMGLTFFSYNTAVDRRVRADDEVTLRYRLDLVGLDGQATGLLPASLAVQDADGESLATVDFVADVRGSLWSLYGLFGISALVFTALTLGAALLALARNRLATGRIARALWFAAPGFGLGLTLTFTLSALRVVTPRAGLWLGLVLGLAAIGAVVGYLTPRPVSVDEEATVVEEEQEPTAEHEAPRDEDATEPTPPVATPTAPPDSAPSTIVEEP